MLADPSRSLPSWMRSRPVAVLVLALTIAVAVWPTDTSAQLPHVVYAPHVSGATLFGAVPIGEGFDQVTAVTHAGDDRLFIVERAGRIKVLQPDGQVSLFLDVSSRVVSSPGEYGMYDLAFHPGFGDPSSAGYGFFYVAYTGSYQGAVRLFISRFQAPAGGLSADPDSETWLLKEQQNYSWHKGGELEFAPDGQHLFAGLGDDKQPLLAQSIKSPKGKLIRLRVDDVPRETLGDATGLIDDEVWVLGLRNPWRFDIDPASGQIFIGDVGEQLWEEVNVLALAGQYANFGWPCMEGSEEIPLFAGYDECQNASAFRLPAFAYRHELDRCAIIGGKVYRPASNPLDGRYIFGDLCSREIWALSAVNGVWQASPLGLVDGIELLATIGEDHKGNLYAGTTSSHAPIYRLAIP